MADSIKDHILTLSSEAFGKRESLLSLWQSIADNFYPERADFTVTRNLGDEFADNLMTSYPVITRRDLGNAFGAMLRPTSKEWKHMRVRDRWDKLGVESKAWIEWADKRMTRAMYDRKSMFLRATKEADHDFAAFGQAVIQVSLNRQGNGLLYRCWHLRDVAWFEDDNGAVGGVFRRWKPKVADLCRLFPNTCHPQVMEKLSKTPMHEIDCIHAIIPRRFLEECADYDHSTMRTEYVSVYIDTVNKHIMEQVGLPEQEYLIPRWQTVSGSQYAYSPATVAALPDARLLQSMTLTLLEAGEKFVNPPMIAVQNAIRGDVAMYAGGLTWADAAYDERLGEVLRPITQDKSGLPAGFNMAESVQAMISEAFYLNKLSLPQPEQEMTAYEVGQRVQEYIRQALPLFEPMEMEYNGPLCDLTFSKMMRAGAFGSPWEMPEELRNMEVEFMFESPLHDATERAKGQRFLEAANMLATAAQLDPTAAQILKADVALRDTLGAIGVPAKWQRSEAEMADIVAQQAKDQQQQQQLVTMQQGADIAETMANAVSKSAAPPTEEALPL